ncbi:MAG: ribonuclease Z [Pyrinomonadaceae bacterium]
MQVTFLGTSSGVPTKSRNLSCAALRLPQRAEVWLFDCGEATQHQLLRSDLKISQLTRIFITHMHGDHIFGLPGLLATCGMAGDVRGLDVYGPPGLDEYVRSSLRHSETRLSYPVAVHVVRDGAVVYQDREYTVSCLSLVHRVISFGYRVQEQDRPGRFQVEKAIAHGVPPGPLFGRLKAGERIALPDQRELDGRDFTGPREAGRSVVYCTDTTHCENAVALSADADLLIHEATFSHEDEHLAKQSLHSTTTMAARVAREARAHQLLMTHFSPRYAIGGRLRPQDLLAEARAVFPQTEMAHDFLTVEVPRRAAAEDGRAVI